MTNQQREKKQKKDGTTVPPEKHIELTEEELKQAQGGAGGFTPSYIGETEKALHPR
ncbi:MAG TPA: hypothetical protein VH540_09695 [Ktedonobacterales bacterium]|jgi:hypothetical protein